MQPGGISKTSDNIQNLVQTVQEKVSGAGAGAGSISSGDVGVGVDQNAVDNDMVSIRLYKDGKLVKTNSGTFSIVGTTPGITELDYTVSLRNTGSQVLSCDIVSLSPSALDSAMTKTTKQIAVGAKVAWTSNLVSVAQFENPTTPTTFAVVAKCSYNPGTGLITLGNKSASTNVIIKPDSTGASFEVDITAGSTPTEFCGDNTCNNGETSTTCPSDCIAINSVKFRTTDVQYATGSAIALTTTCGTVLTAYGYSDYKSTSSSGTSTPCASFMPAGSTWCGGTGTTNTLVQSNLIGGWMSGGEAPSLWKSSNGILCICDSTDANSFQQKKYITTDSDASKVDTSKSLIDSTKEVSC